MIDELYTNLYKRITKNICRNHYLWEELHSEAILIIVEKNFNLSEIRNMKHFFSAIVWKTWHSNKFKKNFMRDHVQYIDNYKCDVLVEEQQEIDFTSIIKFLEQPPATENDYYEQNLFKLYLDSGDAIKLSNKTKIPYRTVVNDIKEIKEKLKRKHNDQNSH